ncbi:MAG: hypothetical protein GX445_02870, partial [Elusimicrobia bacterium]|nr:hypothetical protein [Elusimicrobiota bacterium]
MNIVNKKYFLLFLILFLPSTSEGRTREEVITDAITYSTYSWTPTQNNLLDIERCTDGVGKTNDPNGDGIDDRRQVYSTTTKECSEYSSYWPFEVCSTCTYTGEAYAFSHWDTTTTFNNRIESGNRWIAGRRGIGTPAVPETLPSGYNGFIGIDCSGLVSRVLSLNNYNYTGSLINLMLPISTSSVKRGDLLFRWNPAH